MFSNFAIFIHLQYTNTLFQKTISSTFPGWVDDQAGLYVFDIYVTPMTYTDSSLIVHHTSTEGPEAITDISGSLTSHDVS